MRDSGCIYVHEVELRNAATPQIHMHTSSTNMNAYAYVTCFLPVRAAPVEQRLFDAQLLKDRHVLQSEHPQDTLHLMRDGRTQHKPGKNRSFLSSLQEKPGFGFENIKNASRT